MVVERTARHRITAGVALAAASVITVAPVTQHLPDFHLAQQLSQVSISDIRLSDAADTMVDLFSGVENELASLASGSATAAAAGAALDPTQNLIVQTWMQTFASASTNLQRIVGEMSAPPFPILQQVGANFADYGQLYVGAFQKVATNAVSYFGTGGTFSKFMQTGITDLMAGNISGGLTQFYNGLWASPFAQFGIPLEGILKIPAYMTQNLANATNYMSTTGVVSLADLLLGLPNVTQAALGTSLQTAFNAWYAGEPLLAITNLLNTPGAVMNTFLNGAGKNATNGLLSKNFGAIEGLLAIQKGITNQIIAPGSVNILAGGNVGTAIQQFGNQLVNGWPSLSPVISNISSQLIGTLQNVVTNFPAMLGNFGAALASNIGLLISNILKLL
ncbi:hypothetical protein BST29_17965 [Mycobacterium malmoense]|uniref:PE-PGRS family protein n=1 Tax=Mycobacterium malmoense TaxID=1780 RepID=A0ABX3SN44_MYCMA|nr:hypothetical protein BST29_17965 [Mycobacterium malmoense]